jgi:putative NADH-flavin reductase
MQITIFGASGKVGRQVVDIATKQGYCVVAMVHAHNPFVENELLSVVEGDIHNVSDVRKALVGSAAAISTLGSWGTKNKDILSSAMQTIIPALEGAGITRVVTLTGSGAQAVGESLTFKDKLPHTLLKLVAPKILVDGEEHLRLLTASTLDWTTIRSPIMTNAGTVKYHLKLTWPGPFQTINRHAVAQALVDQISDRQFIKQAPIIYRGS